MSLRVIFDESKNEAITPNRCKKFAKILQKSSTVYFRLLIGPITDDKLADEKILFIGAPKKSFKQTEIESIVKFVSNGNYVIIVCNSSRNRSLNINALSKNFNVRFDFNHIKDEKQHWKNSEYFPLIHTYKEHYLSKKLKKIFYSGSTLTLLSDDCYPVAFTSKSSEPPNSPIVATSYFGRCIAIGGSTLFYDDKYGLDAGNNIRFVLNLLKYLKIGIENPPKLLKYQSTEVKISTPRTISIKKAKNILHKKYDESISKYNQLYDEIDEYYNTTINNIKSKKQRETGYIKVIYKGIQDKIKSIQFEFFELVGKLDNYKISLDKYPEYKNKIINDFYVKESEINEHLDRIYGRLDYYAKNPEAIP
ncbi:MAG: hypothetical protein EU549_01850 [Promethearchaeota archaeon]|nr:MAG: hypothetical protein EU549_01850 [Candidatus Lokiarchaeota archaeon]